MHPSMNLASHVSSRLPVMIQPLPPIPNPSSQKILIAPFPRTALQSLQCLNHDHRVPTNNNSPNRYPLSRTFLLIGFIEHNIHKQLTQRQNRSQEKRNVH